MIPVGVNARWNGETTGGRGQFLQVHCNYQSGERGNVEKWFGLLIQSGSSGQGRLQETTPIFEVQIGDATSYEEREALVGRRFWD
jgi:hypothetical protein